MKYKVITISGIHMKIGFETDKAGYSESIIECNLPTDEEMENWSEKKVDEWIKENNERMKSICDFLNSQV